jgi:hypothetical protein
MQPRGAQELNICGPHPWQKELVDKVCFPTTQHSSEDPGEHDSVSHPELPLSLLTLLPFLPGISYLDIASEKVRPSRNTNTSRGPGAQKEVKATFEN